MRTRIHIALGLLMITVVAAATNPNTAWNGANNGILIPPCAAGGNSPKHWSYPTGQDIQSQALVWDAFRANGYSNIRLDYNAGLYMNADCSLGV